MGSVPPMEGAAAGPALRIRADLLRIRADLLRIFCERTQNDTQLRLPISGNELVKSILWVRRTHFRDISPYPSCLVWQLWLK
eukprot:3087460-Pyramimonas_sp.AAC.1